MKAPERYPFTKISWDYYLDLLLYSSKSSAFTNRWHFFSSAHILLNHLDPSSLFVLAVAYHHYYIACYAEFWLVWTFIDSFDTRRYRFALFALSAHLMSL